eukprot:TRINITY_DN27979_c0_g1_i1.p1 TRINITY_DN27979_c0_g1~~TRINITY_DN27979_c0_g1_i1.p1  ORF type:complete len:210 (-),score=42.16 TRINITY_DN27979_c0_g1_i1:142-771(-)
MKEKFKFGLEYGPRWTILKQELNESPKLRMEDIGTQKMEEWIEEMKSIRNRIKGLYRKEIKMHNFQTLQEIGAESFKKYRNIITKKKGRRELLEVKDSEGRTYCEAKGVKNTIIERVQEIYGQAWPKTSNRVMEKPWMKLPIWEKYRQRAKEFREQGGCICTNREERGDGNTEHSRKQLGTGPGWYHIRTPQTLDKEVTKHPPQHQTIT